MEGIKNFGKSVMGYKPTPAEQQRKCRELIRRNIRQLEKGIRDAAEAERKAKLYIKDADKRAQKSPHMAKQAQKEARGFAMEVVRARKQSNRLVTSKAQLNSVQMQVNEAFALRKIEGSIKASVGIMKEVNQLVKLPALAGTMRELSMELMKAGVVEEMVGEVLPEDAAFEDEEVEAEEEVDKVLGEILKGKMEQTGPLPSAPVAPEPVAAEEEEEDPDAMMDQMRHRLEALRS